MQQANGKGTSKRVQDLLLSRYIEPARRRGQKTVRVVAGDIIRELQLRNRAPQVCTAMQGERFLRQHGLKIIKREGPPSGQSTTVALTYQSDGDQRFGHELFDALCGSLKGAFAEEGGVSGMLERDRAAWAKDDEF